MAEQIEKPDIDGWWAVRDKTVSGSPELWAVFTSKALAEDFRRTLIEPSDFDVKEVGEQIEEVERDGEVFWDIVQKGEIEQAAKEGRRYSWVISYPTKLEAESAIQSPEYESTLEVVKVTRK